MATKTTKALAQNWFWKQRDAAVDLFQELTQGNASLEEALSLQSIQHNWVPATTPCEIHVELLKHGLIPDPYVGFGEHHIQWIGEVEWLFKCSFSVEEAREAFLTFEGLDTICDIYLNEEKILEADNMILAYE